MARVLLLSLVAAGLMYAAYAALFAGEVELIDSPITMSEAEAPETTGETPWTAIDPAAQNSRHAILPETDRAPTSAPASLSADAQAAAEQAQHVTITAPASIREGPSSSAAILGIARPGAEAQVISRQVEWQQIIDPESKKAGWIQSSFLEPQTKPGSRALSKEEIEAALDDAAGDDRLAPETSKPSATQRKSHKHVSRHSHRRRGLSLRFFLRRVW